MNTRKLTYLGNGIVLISYWLMLKVNPIYAGGKVIGGSILIYCFIKEKRWDIAAMLTLFSCVDISVVLNVLFGGN